MASLSFEEAAKQVLEMKYQPTEAQKLKLYGLYKQSVNGDVQGEQPWMIQIEARKKWDAWNARKGTNRDDAKKFYVEYVAELMAADKK